MKFKYKLFQVQRDKTREVGFMGLDMMERLNIEVDGVNYVKTYEGEEEAKDVMEGLELLFHKFNMERPSDFTYYSMSVGDIVEIDGVTYFCDSWGWKVREVKNLPVGV